jgi:hypothetical protein
VTKKQIDKVVFAVKSTSDSFTVISYTSLLFTSGFYFIANFVEVIDLIQSLRFLNFRIPINIFTFLQNLDVSKESSFPNFLKLLTPNNNFDKIIKDDDIFS